MLAAQAGLGYDDLAICDFVWLNAKLSAAESRTRRLFEAARMVAFFAVKPYDAKDKLKKFEQLVGFPWDAKPVQPEPMTPEEIEKFIQEAMDFINSDRGEVCQQLAP